MQVFVPRLCVEFLALLATGALTYYTFLHASFGRAVAAPFASRQPPKPLLF